MSLKLGTNNIAGIPTGLIDTVNSKADANNVYSKSEIDSRVHIINTYINGTSGYRIWSDGYCEQWGSVFADNTYRTVNVSFLKTFKDTNYNLVGGNIGTNTSVNCSNQGAEISYQKNTTGFSMWISTTGYTKTKDWKACGYLASGQY